MTEASSAGSVNWTEASVEASGQAVVDLKKWSNEAQAIAMATRGAEVVAKANLLEMVQGVRLERHTTVKDMMAESDLITTRVEGLVKGTRPVGQPVVANGMVTVTLRMPVFGNSGVLAAALPPTTLPEAPLADNMDTLDAELVFRLPPGARQPAVFPSFADESGALLLDGVAFGAATGEPLSATAHRGSATRCPRHRYHGRRTGALGAAFHYNRRFSQMANYAGIGTGCATHQAGHAVKCCCPLRQAIVQNTINPIRQAKKGTP